jgi:hypothetical protein
MVAKNFSESFSLEILDPPIELMLLRPVPHPVGPSEEYMPPFTRISLVT